MNPENIWLAEYSVTQGAFHIETGREMMESNLRQIVGGWTNNYLLFAVCGSHDEASRACDTLAKAMEQHGGRPTIAGASVRMPEDITVEAAEVTP